MPPTPPKINMGAAAFVAGDDPVAVIVPPNSKTPSGCASIVLQFEDAASQASNVPKVIMDYRRVVAVTVATVILGQARVTPCTRDWHHVEDMHPAWDRGSSARIVGDTKRIEGLRRVLRWTPERTSQVGECVRG